MLRISRRTLHPPGRTIIALYSWHAHCLFFLSANIMEFMRHTQVLNTWLESGHCWHRLNVRMIFVLHCCLFALDLRPNRTRHKCRSGRVKDKYVFHQLTVLNALFWFAHVWSKGRFCLRQLGLKCSLLLSFLGGIIGHGVSWKCVYVCWTWLSYRVAGFSMLQNTN